MAHSSRLSRIETGDRPWTFRGSRLEGVSPPCQLVHCRLCLPGGRKGLFSPLESALRYDRRNACPSRKLPAAGCCPFARSVTYQTRLRLCDVKSQCASPPYSTDAHAAANLDQIEEIDHMFDAVGIGSVSHLGSGSQSAGCSRSCTLSSTAHCRLTNSRHFGFSASEAQVDQVYGPWISRA